MAQLMDHITYLSKEIGPRPAGTEEEQRAALYITEQFQKETGFTAAMEDFSSSSNVEMGLAVMAGIVVVTTILAMLFPVLVIPAFVLAAAAAVVYSLEIFDRPIISRVLSRGASQNVVAKYQPSNDGEARMTRRGSSRKVILMAHYDTGNVTPPLVARIEGMGIPVALICVAAIIASAFFALIRIFIASGGGMGPLVLNVLSVIALIICLYPIAKAVMLRMSPYNEGATNNATGTAALIEIARRIARGSVSEAELADSIDGEVVIHGEEAARAAGLVPEGVELIYEAEEIQPAPAPEPEIPEYNEEERLLSAKAAIAALTGKPVESKIYGSVASNLVNPRVEADEAGYMDDYAPYDADGMPYEGDYSWDGYGDAAGPQGQPYEYKAEKKEDAEGFENAPSWFVAAQQNARRSESEREGAEPQVKRSRYTEAIENAERGLAQKEEEMRAAKQAEREAAQRAREAEFRALMEAREAEHAAAARPVTETPATTLYREDIHGQMPVMDATPVETVPEPVQDPVNATAVPMSAPSPQVAVQVPEEAVETPASAPMPVTAVQAPDSTTAMPMHVPSSEIIAEALAADPNIFSPSSQEPAVQELPAQESVAQEPEIIVPEVGEVAEPEQKGVLNASAIPSPIEEEPAGNRISALPSIDPSNPYSDPEAKTSRPSLAEKLPEMDPAPSQASEPSRSGILRKLRTSIPSLSGLIAPAPSKEEPAPAKESVSKVDYDMELPVENAPSSTEPPVQGSNAVEIPRSRSGSLLNRFRQSGNEGLSDTPQQWLEVQEDFDPRSVGRDRGGWESFRDDQQAGDGQVVANPPAESDESANGTGRRWQGGAYSRLQLGHVNTRSGEETEADIPPVEEPVEIEMEKPIAEEIEQIYHFRNPQFSTEVWFVAVGADGESHDGARAFLDEHRDELRGSMIIEIESLGAGMLSFASEEGRIRKAAVSSRVKRLTRTATAATGLAVDSVSLKGTDSIASTLQKAGFQAMHLFGAEDGRPALKGSADDVVENVDELALEEHISFVYELLKR